MVRQPFNEVSQKKLVVVEGGETVVDRDITDYERAIQDVDSNKKMVLLTARNKGHKQLAKDQLLSYGQILRLDYKDR